ncbi:hypothetical protein DVH24_003435 [Malus domestica]|uniref:Uncharacterized protein n=1 Tax=Malus domestica TaxID=3750 RepID=A0A498ILJ0_MALDO|nr:hypothetical protein DVH24_003435 [Malus domestica]
MACVTLGVLASTWPSRCPQTSGSGWQIKKQKVVALSSAEAECRGLTKGLCELLWLPKLLTELGCQSTSATKLFCDNKTTMIFLIIQFSMTNQTY